MVKRDIFWTIIYALGLNASHIFFLGSPCSLSDACREYELATKTVLAYGNTQEPGFRYCIGESIDCFQGSHMLGNSAR